MIKSDWIQYTKTSKMFDSKQTTSKSFMQPSNETIKQLNSKIKKTLV